MSASAANVAGAVGVIYLLHFTEPYHHARHYLGWTTDLDARLASHAAGQGARLLAAVRAAGGSWELAGTWAGTRARERQIKRQGSHARRMCSVCQAAAARDLEARRAAVGH